MANPLRRLGEELRRSPRPPGSFQLSAWAFDAEVERARPIEATASSASASRRARFRSAAPPESPLVNRLVALNATRHRAASARGHEWMAAFDKECQPLGIEHRRTRARHAWTNGFVERLQGTILTELWRCSFRQTYYTAVAPMQRDLDRYLRLYNFERPHRGCWLRGRTPAEVFYAHNRPRRTVNAHPELDSLEDSRNTCQRPPRSNTTMSASW
jgi:transposase InsO family protein